MGETRTLKLTEFLLARIAEDESVAIPAAREAAGDSRVNHEPTHETWECNEQGHHLALAPARVLAECAAKRRIVEMHHDGMERYYYEGDDGDRSESYCARCTVDHTGERWPCDTMRALASVYADHPDFAPAWAVTI